MKNQRKSQRFDVNIQGELDKSDSLPSDMLLANLSIGGCYVRTDSPEPAGSTIKLRFRLPGIEGRELETNGHVCWNSSDDAGDVTGMGIQFKDMDNDISDMLKRYIAGLLDTDLE